jgi:hypothetical protein
MSEQAAATIGDNLPPNDAQIMHDNFSAEYAEIVDRSAELAAGAEVVPDVIDNADTAASVTDFIKQITACAKRAETARVNEKEPHLAAERAVDGFFKKILGPLARAKNDLNDKLTDYQKEQAAIERRRRLKEEQEAREREAEARRVAAEAAERERQENERQRAEAAAAAEPQQSLDVAIEAEAAAPAPEERHEIAAEAVATKAEHAEAKADVAEAAVASTAKASDLHKTRGDFGGHASLRTTWKSSDVDRESLDLEALRHCFHQNDLEKAVRKFVSNGGRRIKGAKIFETTKSVVS